MRLDKIALILITVIFAAACNQQSNNENVDSNVFVGLWESTSDSGANAHAALNIEVNGSELIGVIEYSTLAASGGQKRAMGKTSFYGLIAGNEAQIELKNNEGAVIGNAQIALVDGKLKYSTIAEGVNFPDQFFVKRTAEVSKKEVVDGSNQSRWNEFRNRGVEFLATGNEPFWSLEINQNGTVFFKSLGEFGELTIPMPKPVYGEDGRIARYLAKNQSATLDFVIQQMPCTDNMSGATFGYFVSVALSGAKETKPLLLEGCGSYLGDYRLHDIWALTHINEIEIKETQIARERPYLEFNLNSGEMLGMAGCNTISGKITMGNRNIFFGPIAGTKMACEAMELEGQMLNLISDQAVKYSIGSGILRLEGKNGTLTFRKVD
jgi:heat shock protein HslJ